MENFKVPEKNTAFHYYYRDGSNYKLFGKVILQGALTTEEKLSVSKHLYNGEFFIPSALGLESLPDAEGWDRGPDDHPFHTFDEIEDTDLKPSSDAPTAQEFLQKLLNMNAIKWEKAASEWDKEPSRETGRFSQEPSGPFL